MPPAVAGDVVDPMITSERHAAQWRHWIHPRTQLVEPPYENLHCCFICRCDFTFFIRRHHCRSCGRTTCNDHSDNFAPVAALEIQEAVRVCDLCFVSLAVHPPPQAPGPALSLTPKPEPAGVAVRECIASSRCELGCSTIAEHLAGGPASRPADEGVRNARSVEAVGVGSAPPDSADGTAQRDTEPLPGSPGHDSPSESASDAAEPTPPDAVCPLSFAEELWDSLDIIARDIEEQTSMCTSLAEYLRARCQLEDEYCQRLNSLGQDISIARYRREQVHADSELVRPFLTIFNVITEAAEVVSNEHAARAREIREQAYEACSDTVKHQQEQLRSITSDIKAWKTRLRHANIELENSQTLYIKAKQKAAETQAQAARSTGGARAQDQADAAEAELASVKEAYVHQLAGANSLHREFYAEGGKTTELLGRLEQMATAAPSSICSPAQVLAAGDGVSQQVVDTFPKVCRRGCVGDLHEYIIRNATGRPRPVDIAFESYDELFIGSHTVRLVSLEPLRTWEVDLNNRRVTLRGAGEELVFGAHKIVELGRAARSRVEAVLGIEGLLQGEELKGGGLSRAARQGSKAGGGTAESSAADSQGISRLDLRFPSPAWRELFINALQSVRRQSAADDCPPCDDAVDWTPPAWTTALCPNEDATVCLDSLTTWVGSINLGSTAELPERLQGWMPKDRYALYVVGVANGEMTENDLSQQLQRHLGPGHVRIAAKSLAFLRIFAFIRAPMRPYVSSVECGVVSVLKTMRQCGGAAIALRYHETAFAFICLWIPPDERKQQTAKDRCTRVNDIIGDLKNAFKLWPDKGLSLCSQYVHTVVFGETNFRIDMPQHTISTLAAESAWEEIYLADQLRISREAGAVLAEFTEAEPPYPPTVRDPAHTPSTLDRQPHVAIASGH